MVTMSTYTLQGLKDRNKKAIRPTITTNTYNINDLYTDNSKYFRKQQWW